MRELWSPRWVARHLGAALLVLGFLALGYWQIRRAASGNALSWAYALEWPVFAGFVIFIWAREVRFARRGGRAPGAEPGAAQSELAAAQFEPAAVKAELAAAQAAPEVVPRRPVLTARRSTAYDDASDPELAAYNRYLAWLNANPGTRPTDYPG